MSVEEAIVSLEHAALSLTGHGSSVEERMEAEQVFLEFKATPSPYDLCFQILAGSSNDYVRFEVFEALKEAVVREYSQTSFDTVSHVRDHVLSFITENSTLAAYARTAGLSCVALCYKIQWNEASSSNNSSDEGADGGASVPAQFFATIDSLLSSSDDAEVELATTLMLQLLFEFSTSKKSSSVGLTWDVHIALKRVFEHTHLVEILSRCASILQAICDSADRAVFLHIFPLLEEITNWDFYSASQRRMIGTYAHAKSEIFKPPPEWAESVITPSFVANLFKTLEMLISAEAPDLDAASEVAVQLSTIPSSSFPSRESEGDYVASFIQGLSVAIQSLVHAATTDSSGQTQLPENLTRAFAVMCKHLLHAHPPQIIISLSAADQELFLSALYSFTGQILTASVEENDDNAIFTESFEAVLSTWLSLAHYPEGLHVHISEMCAHVFDQYLASRMEKARRDGLSEEEVREEDESDEVRYSEQLLGVAEIARKGAYQTLPALYDTLHTKLASYAECLDNPQPNLEELYVLHEEVHWLLLISACTLADPASGEVPVVPAEINTFCAQTDSEGGDSNVVALIVGDVLNLVQKEEDCFQNGNAGNLSPQVSATMMYFFQRVCSSYLFLDPSLYKGSICDSLMRAFGDEAASNIIVTLVQKASRNLSVWASDEGVIHASVKMLEVMVGGRHQRRILCESGLLHTLATAMLAQETACMDDEAFVRVACCVCRVATALPSEEDREGAFTAVLDTASSTLSGIMLNEQFLASFEAPETIAAVTRAFATVRGVAQSSVEATLPLIARLTFPLIADDQLPQLFSLYKHNTQVRCGILFLVLDFTTHWVAAAVRESMCTQELVFLYKGIHALLRTWAELAINDKGESAIREEWQIEELKTILSILNGLSSIEYFDFLDKNEKEPMEVEAADVVLEGIGFVCPVMTEELVQMPDVSSKFFTMLDIAAEAFPAKVYACSSDRFEQISLALKLGIEASSISVVRCSLGVIQSLTSAHLKQIGSGAEGSWDFMNMSGSLMQYLFESFVFKEFDMDLMESASASIYMLICTNLDQYETCCAQFIEAQEGEAEKEALQNAFHTLVTANNIEFDNARKSKHVFSKNFSAFLMRVRGFLLKK